jgi:hypothetical protein
MPDDDYNLRRAEEHVAEARRLLLGQKGLITRIRAAGIDTSNGERILKVLERNLKTFEEHRDALKRRHVDVGPSAADEADSNKWLIPFVIVGVMSVAEAMLIWNGWTY